MSDWIALVESAYRLDGGLEDWVAGIRDEAGPLLDRGMGVAVHTFQASLTRLESECVATWAGPPNFGAIVRDSNRNATPDGVARFLGWGTQVSTMSEAVFAASPAEHHEFQETVEDHSSDVLGVVALVGRGHGISISIPIAERRRATVQERRDLGRVGAHLAAGFRLRAALAGVGPDSPDRDGEAVLDPDGHVHSAIGPARLDEPRQRLREAVLRLEATRAGNERHCADALDVWQGLVRGRWSLVDRFDSDGRRFVVAHRNAPQLGDPRGLSVREHQVCEHIGAGRSNKEIAYEFGISEPAVANASAHARRKLGIESRIELARFFAPGGVRARLVTFDFVGENFATATAAVVDESLLGPLSPAERDVALQLLQGATNHQIAESRGTSINTVSNQIQSIFTRLGVRSRVELAAHVQAR